MQDLDEGAELGQAAGIGQRDVFGIAKVGELRGVVVGAIDCRNGPGADHVRAGRAIEGFPPGLAKLLKLFGQVAALEGIALRVDDLPAGVAVDLPPPVIRVGTDVPLAARADDQPARGHVAPVGQVVAVRVAMPPADGIAGKKLGQAGVIAQGRGAGEEVDELVLGRVPVAVAGPGAGVERVEIGAELGDPARDRQVQGGKPLLAADGRGGGIDDHWPSPLRAG